MEPRVGIEPTKKGFADLCLTIRPTRRGSEGGTRTRTAFNGQRILSPSCLPVPPLRLGGADEIRTRDILLAKQVLYQLSYGPMEPSEGFEPPTP